MARTFGLMSELAWPDLSAACPRSWRAWSKKNVGNMVKDQQIPAHFLMGEYRSSLSSMAALGPSQCAITFLYHILRRRVAKLEQGSHLTHGVAWMIASNELYAPISCILLVMHHQMFQECCPIVQTQDQPRELPPPRGGLPIRNSAPKGSRGQMLHPGKVRIRS